jgi:hypothetical protein
MRLNQHDFFKMMATVKDSLARDYERIRARSRDDPGTAGDQAEEDWAAILKNWLPASYPITTKGRILFEDGSSSPQVDVLVLTPSYPLGLRSEKYVFAGGVIAAFECKLTLRREHIKNAFKTAGIIKRKARKRIGTPYDELNSMPIFGLLAHSHTFPSKRASWKLHEMIEKYQADFALHPRELLDVICVADSGTFPLSKHLLMGCDLTQEEKAELAEIDGARLISTMYVIHDEEKMEVRSTGAILAGLIHELTYRIAFEDASIREWADHLSYLGWYGGIGRSIYWTGDDLTIEVRETLQNSERQTNRWSKWCRYLP